MPDCAVEWISLVNPDETPTQSQRQDENRSQLLSSGLDETATNLNAANTEKEHLIVGRADDNSSSDICGWKDMLRTAVCEGARSFAALYDR